MKKSRILFVLLYGIIFLLHVHVNQACNPCKKKKTTDTITYRQIENVIPQEPTTTQITNSFQHTNQIETTNPMQITTLTKKNNETISDRIIDKISPLESITTHMIAPVEIMKPSFLTLKPHVYRIILHFLEVNDINTHLFVRMILHYKPDFFATMSIQNKYDFIFDLMFNTKNTNHSTYETIIKLWGNSNSTVKFTRHEPKNFSHLDLGKFHFDYLWGIYNGKFQKQDIQYSSYEVIYDYQNEILTSPKLIQVMQKLFFPFVIIFTFYDKIPQVKFIFNLQMIQFNFFKKSVTFICVVHQSKVQITLFKDQNIRVLMCTEDSDDSLYRREYYYHFDKVCSQSKPEFKRYNFFAFSTVVIRFPGNSKPKYDKNGSFLADNFNKYINDDSILHIKNIYIKL